MEEDQSGKKQASPVVRVSVCDADCISGEGAGVRVPYTKRWRSFPGTIVLGTPRKAGMARMIRIGLIQRVLLSGRGILKIVPWELLTEHVLYPPSVAYPCFPGYVSTARPVIKPATLEVEWQEHSARQNRSTQISASEKNPFLHIPDPQ